MSRPRRTSRAGLTLLELILSLSVTTMVGLAVASMLGAVTAGVETHRDSRTVMVRAHAAQTRLSAYLAPCRCVLAASEDELVIWLRDSRKGDTVHATEIRWLRYDEDADTITAHFVRFPEAWADGAKALLDTEHPAGSDWSAVYNGFAAAGWTAAMPLVDGVSGFAAAMEDGGGPQSSRHVCLTLMLDRADEPEEVQIACTLRMHAPPKS